MVLPHLSLLLIQRPNSGFVFLHTDPVPPDLLRVFLRYPPQAVVFCFFSLAPVLQILNPIWVFSLVCTCLIQILAFQEALFCYSNCNYPLTGGGSSRGISSGKSLTN